MLPAGQPPTVAGNGHKMTWAGLVVSVVGVGLTMADFLHLGLSAIASGLFLSLVGLLRNRLHGARVARRQATLWPGRDP